MQHIEEAGIHSGDSSCVLPAVSIREETLDVSAHLHAQAGPGAQGRRPGQPAVRHPARCRGQRPCLRHRSEPARLAHRALRLQSHRHSAGQDRRAPHDRPHAARTSARATCLAARISNRLAFLCQIAGLSLDQVCRRRYGSRPGDEVHRRSDGRGRQLWRGLCQGAALRRTDSAHRRHRLLQRQRPRQARPPSIWPAAMSTSASRSSPPRARPMCWRGPA